MSEVPISKRRVLYDDPRTGVVRRASDVRLGGSGALTLDTFERPDLPEDAALVVIVNGYPDAGFEERVGCRFKDLPSTTDWASLIAARGVRVVTCTSGTEPVNAALAVLAAVRRRWSGAPIRLFAISGHTALAMSLLSEPSIERAAVMYGPLPDPVHVHAAHAKYRFAYRADVNLADVRRDTALLVVRAGGDTTPHINASIDAFLGAALSADLSLTLINVPGMPHAFDTLTDAPMARAAVANVLHFLST